MELEAKKMNAQDLELEFEWLSNVINTRMELYFGNESDVQDIFSITPPVLKNKSMYAGFIEHYEVDFAERVTILLALAPHVKPQLLDTFFARNSNSERGFTEFGGIMGKTHGGFIPTGETVLFVLAGNDLDVRFSFLHLFDRDHFLSRHTILKLTAIPDGEPFLSGALNISSEIIDYFTTGAIRKPDFSPNFPAHHITTKLEWSDLILDDYTLKQISELKTWVTYEDQLMNEWGLGNKLRPGYRCLFHGLSGTGKTMTACLLGKETDRDVYRIDLSSVISKYIGETEKNLSKIFDQAESKNWILFFDEADALFGKRTKIDDAHDKHANQEVSYLLQRLEVFDGIVILASNMKSNLDGAFTRRFESIIHFPMPQPSDRLRLWKNSFSPKSKLANDVNLESISDKYELSGGTTMNVVRYCSLKVLEKGTNIIQLKDLEEGIRREIQKEGKTV